MVRVVLASHGCLAEGMLSAAQMIMDELENLTAYGLDTCETPQRMAALVEEEIKAFPDDAFILLCDIKGGSVYNQLLPLCACERVSLITGMNLNLVLELVVPPSGVSHHEMQQQAVDVARTGIIYFDKKTVEQQKEGDDALW